MLKNRFCPRPFEFLEIDHYLCGYPCCADWLPTSGGSLEKMDLMKLWNSPTIQKIRKSILDGSFEYCNHERCPHLQTDTLPNKDQASPELKSIVENEQTCLESLPREIALSYDYTCNLSCPSCRKEKIALRDGSDYEKRLLLTQQFICFLESYSPDNPCRLLITGSGDPIASSLFFYLLTHLDPAKCPTVRITLHTNGTLLNPTTWQRLQRVHPLIDHLSISIDAATKETYSKVRRGGSWTQLLKNLSFLCELRRQEELKGISFNFVVQKDNYREIPAFIAMAKRYEVVGETFFSLVSDWGSWTKEEFENQAIWKSSHPEFLDFLEVLKSPQLNSQNIFLGALGPLREMAINGNDTAVFNWSSP